MKVSQLRDLTRKYASGALEREAYLEERKRLIDAITAGEEPARYREIDTQPVGRTRPATPTRRARLAASVLLLVLVIAFMAHFFSSNESNSSGNPIQQTTADRNPATELLQSFNDRDDWSESSLRQVEKEWQSLAPASRQAGKGSVAYRRLKREVNARIREQEALITTDGEPDALMQAARLRMFAERLEMTR